MAQHTTSNHGAHPCRRPMHSPQHACRVHEARAPTPAENAAVLFDHVVKRFGKEEVLHGLSFRVPWGEILGVIGPSGSGKTTTIRMMLGMYKPSEGTVRLFGRDPWKLRRSDRERIGYMPQDFVLYPALTTEENLRFAASLYGVPWWETRRRIDQLLAVRRSGGRAHAPGGGPLRRHAAAALARGHADARPRLPRPR